MEIRVGNIIVNADIPNLGKGDVLFLNQVANFTMSYFHADKKLKRIASVLLADIGVTMAKIALLEDLKGEEKDDDKGGGV